MEEVLNVSAMRSGEQPAKLKVRCMTLRMRAQQALDLGLVNQF